MKLLKFVFISLLVVSCKKDIARPVIHQEQNASQIVIDSLKNEPEIVKEHFDVEKFIDSANFLLSDIKRKQINLSYKVDTIKNDLNRRSFIGVISENRTVVKKYTFDLGKGDRILNFRILEIICKDSLDALSVFKNLISDAYEVNESPGLTYTNDYVMKTQKNIYWLNTGCAYSYANHLKMKEFMMQSLIVEKITDSIHCKCGQVTCYK